MAEKTATEIAALVAKIKRYPYEVNFGETDLGPLENAPEFSPDVETEDVTLYETGKMTVASYLDRNEVEVTINTRDIESAIPLMAAIKEGDNIFDSTKKSALVLVPITSETGAKSITFPNAWLMPGMNFNPGENEAPSVVPLTFKCKSDPTSHVLFTYSAGTSSVGG